MMYRSIRILLLLLLLSLSLLFGCRPAESGTSDDVSVPAFLVAQIEAGMTKGEIHSLLGPSHFDSFSRDYPYGPSWLLDDGRTLTIIMKIDGIESSSELHQYLVDEGLLHSPSSDGELHYTTKEESQAFREWLHTNAKAICAYILDGQEKIVLFGTP